MIIKLSKPSAMPDFGYGLPASSCKTGSKLRKKAGSVCEKCYACRGNYQYDNVQKCQQERLTQVKSPAWVSAMVEAIIVSGSLHFRWHDSGDLQSLSHLKKIIEVCEKTPMTKHWLPTKEHKLIKLALVKGVQIPANLTIRLSAHFIGELVKEQPWLVQTCSVNSGEGFLCPKTHNPRQNNCGTCRACWDKNVINVDYKKH